MTESRRTLLAGLGIALAIGFFLRCNQLPSQVLLEDEWHPVHQVVYYSLSHILGSFGNADYSIPLTALYWAQAETIGLTEIGLRMPALLAGLATVVALPWWLRDRMDARVLAVFAVLLAVAPFLVSYSRMARSYAVTLFGVYAALWLLDRATRDAQRVSWRFGVAYALVAGLVAWAHPITGPILVAPFLALAWDTIRGRGLAWVPLIALGALTAALMAAAVLPPLLNDPAALAGKAGMDLPTVETAAGTWHLWMGTGSRIAAVVALVLVGLGFKAAWRSVRFIRWLWMGLGLTLLAVVITRPYWVDRPLALARYLLPAVPALLLALAAGIVLCADGLARAFARGSTPAAWWFAPLGIVLVMAWWPTSPNADVLHRPNSYTQHSYFQYDYRTDMNPIRTNLRERFPVSSFWAEVAKAPPDTIKIAVAPFQYATYEWPAPAWELAARQRVIPAFLWGACVGARHGEVPLDERFALRNAVHVAYPWTLAQHGVTYLAYFKARSQRDYSAPMPECEAWMRSHFGKPDHEDEALLVWKAPIELKPDSN